MAFWRHIRLPSQADPRLFRQFQGGILGSSQVMNCLKLRPTVSAYTCYKPSACYSAASFATCSTRVCRSIKVLKTFTSSTTVT
jgi:hypothetical protein